MTFDSKKIAAIGLITLGIALVYWRVFLRLVDAWTNDGNYSHGFLIIPLAAYFAWERKDRLLAAPTRPSWLGLVVVAGSILVLLAGVLGSEQFLTRISLLGALAGIVLFLWGWSHLRILFFPLALLLLMVPAPEILFNKITLPLQLFASRVGESAISAANIPVLREGNVLILANTSLEVAEACSGIRSLVSLLTLAIVYGYFTDSRGWVRTLLALSTIPVAIIANGLRVAGTGIGAHWWGPEVAQGFIHELSGWLVFVVAFVLIFSIQRVIVRIAPERRAPTKPPAGPASITPADVVVPASRPVKS